MNQTDDSGVFSEFLLALTNTERAVIERIMGEDAEWCVKSEAEWLKYRGLGSKLLEKLRKHGWVLVGFEEPKELSTRALNALWNARIPPIKAEVKAAIESGILEPKKLRNCGKKVDEELRTWVGLPSRPVLVEKLRVPRKLWKFHPVTGEPI